MSSPLDIERSKDKGTSPAEGTPVASSQSRHVSIARLASPVPSHSLSRSPTQEASAPVGVAADTHESLPALENQSSLPGPGQSALAAALAESQKRDTSRSRVSHHQPEQPITPGLGAYDRPIRSNYGSFDNREATGSPGPSQDPEIVRRHLVQPGNIHTRSESPLQGGGNIGGQGIDSDEFSSLRLQGGDITRPIYRWTQENEGSNGSKVQRSKSFSIRRPEPESEVLDIGSIKVPGGFRRDFLRRAVGEIATEHDPSLGLSGSADNSRGRPSPGPYLFTNNFLEFLTLYGHFAGEDLEEDEEVFDPDEYFEDTWDENAALAVEDRDREPGEGSSLLAPRTPGGRRRKYKERSGPGNNTSFGAALLLLKSFVGTGVLFLPRAYLNGGMLFSNLVLLGVACLSYYSFILLVKARLVSEGSFGDIGGVLYGKWMRGLILFSIVISQIGFVSAYIVFTSENLQAFILAVSKCTKFIDIKFMVLMQLIIFLPLSLIRDISKLGFTALVADAFIMLGLLYLYYYDIATIINQGGISDVKAFNPSHWTLFIGTAIFTFEGVGLIIPIQESMKRPGKFPGVLALVMVVITVLFISMGALSYAAYGSKTQTVVLLNLPQDDKFVNAVQFLYSFAILLSTPLQLFPAIRIMENEFFSTSKSGKHSPYVKWQKNVFRFVLVLMCAFIAWGGAGDLDKFVSLVGSFACVPLVYVYPPLLHLKAVARTSWQRAADYALCCFGMIGCVYTTVLSIYLWVDSSPSKVPGYCSAP